MEKVKLPREVAEALDKSKHMGSVAIMAHIARFGNSEAMKTTLELSLIHSFYKENPYLIASALINGYEVEQTQEEQIKQIYLDTNSRYAMEAIVKILNLLNIKISGVNDQ